MDEKDTNLLVHLPFERHMKFSRLYPTWKKLLNFTAMLQRHVVHLTSHKTPQNIGCIRSNRCPKSIWNYLMSVIHWGG